MPFFGLQPGTQFIVAASDNGQFQGQAGVIQDPRYGLQLLHAFAAAKQGNISIGGPAQPGAQGSLVGRKRQFGVDGEAGYLDAVSRKTAFDCLLCDRLGRHQARFCTLVEPQSMHRYQVCHHSEIWGMVSR